MISQEYSNQSESLDVMQDRWPVTHVERRVGGYCRRSPIWNSTHRYIGRCNFQTSFYTSMFINSSRILQRFETLLTEWAWWPECEASMVKFNWRWVIFTISLLKALKGSLFPDLMAYSSMKTFIWMKLIHIVAGRSLFRHFSALCVFFWKDSVIKAFMFWAQTVNYRNFLVFLNLRIF